MADSSLLIHVDQTDALTKESRDGKTLLRRVVRHLQSILSGSKRANSIRVWADGADPVAASGTIACATALATHTATVNGVVFTAVAGAAGANQFSIDGTDTQDAAALAAAINASTSAGIVGVVSATSAAAVVTVTCLVPGVIGNAITLASSGATLAVSGAKLASGAGSAVAPVTITL